MVESLLFKTEIDELKAILNEANRSKKSPDELDAELEAFFESFNEKSQNYVKENRGEFGLRSESDSPVGT